MNIDGGWIPDVSLYEDFPSEIPGRQYNVADYFRVIESCSIHPIISATQASDYVNTYDQHLAWAGIDPTRMMADERRPVYVVSKDEGRWAKRVSKHWGKFVMIQSLASSPARSYLGISQLEKIAKDAGRQVLWWNGNKWMMDGTPIPFPKDLNPMRATAALIQRAALLVSADTCVSHIAEAVGTKHLTWYTTVPAWTRSRDYVNEITIDSEVKLDSNGEPCKCCVIGRDCIRRQIEAREVLSDRDKELIGVMPDNVRQQQGLGFIPRTDTGGKHPIEYFNAASNDGLKAQVDAAVTKWESQRQLPAYCVDNLRGILPGKLEEVLS